VTSVPHSARLVPAYVALGSNLDDPRAQVERAFAALASLPQTILVLRSSLYASPPFGPVEQPDFVNAVAGILTGLEPGQVLYIGDHPTDIRCAEHANRELAGLGRSLRVVSVAALWGLEAGDDRWATTADHRAVTPNEVVELVERLARDQD